MDYELILKCEKSKKFRKLLIQRFTEYEQDKVDKRYPEDIKRFVEERLYGNNI